LQPRALSAPRVQLVLKEMWARLGLLVLRVRLELLEQQVLLVLRESKV
jgi:hypothetical protein